MKAIVTGSAGFVGSSLAGQLIRDGHSVVGIDCLTDYYSRDAKRQNLAEIADPALEQLNLDLAAAEGLEAILADVDVVFHQAGQPGVRASWGSEFSTYLHANVLATQNLLEACRRLGKSSPKVVYASSSSVYGNAESYPTTEALKPQPISPYGVTKLAAEHLVSLYASEFGVPGVSLRYFTVYGPRQRPDMAFTRFTRAFAEGLPITLYGDGTQTREFTYIDDVVRANLLAATTDVPPGLVVNVSGGSTVSVNEALDIIAGIAGRQVPIERQAPAPGDARRTSGATDLISKHLGWRPVVSIEDGLRLHYEWTVQRVKEQTIRG